MIWPFRALKAPPKYDPATLWIAAIFGLDPATVHFDPLSGTFSVTGDPTPRDPATGQPVTGGRVYSVIEDPAYAHLAAATPSAVDTSADWQPVTSSYEAYVESIAARYGLPPSAVNVQDDGS